MLRGRIPNGMRPLNHAAAPKATLPPYADGVPSGLEPSQTSGLASSTVTVIVRPLGAW